jgi:predicted outer membrane repeat protein
MEIMPIGKEEDMNAGKKLRILGLVVLFLMVVGIGLVASPRPNGGVIYVKASALGANDGTSWANAFTDLQSALAAAVAGQQIWVAAGTYKPSSTGDQSAGFGMKSGVGLYGGFPDSGDPASLDDRDWNAYPTILSGDLGVPGDYSDNSYHVVTAFGFDPTGTSGVLDGFFVTGGAATNGGGGLYCNGFNLTISHVTFDSNQAASDSYEYYGGGGALVYACSPVFSDVIFSNNKVITAVGGGLFANSSTPILNDVIFDSNTAVSGYGSGAGMACAFADVILNGAVFSGNHAQVYGGAVYMESGNASMMNVRFLDNQSDSNGGAIYIHSGTHTIVNALFAGNQAGSFGVFGGAIFIFDYLYSPPTPRMTLINSTFSRNSAPSGGAIFNLSPLVMTNCILWNNNANDIASHPDIYNANPTMTATLSYCDYDPNLSTNISGSTGCLNADPKFVDPDEADYRLQAGSPAIDAGQNSAVILGVTTDLNGEDRFQDDPATVDTGDGTPPIVDMGAFEYVPLTAPSVTLQPSDQTVTEGDPASFAAAASGSPAPTVQWQSSLDGIAWADIIGATSETLTFASTTLSMDQMRYRAVFSNGVTPDAETDAAKLTVMPGVQDTALAKKQQILAELQNLLATLTNKDDQKKLEEAIKHLEKSVKLDGWEDGWHPKPGGKGEGVFNEESETAKKLQELRDKNKGGLPEAQIQDYIDRLLAVDRAIAERAIDEAKTDEGKAKKIESAEKELLKGDAEAAKDKPDKAIDHYKNAWKNALAA